MRHRKSLPAVLVLSCLIFSASFVARVPGQARQWPKPKVEPSQKYPGGEKRTWLLTDADGDKLIYVQEYDKDHKSLDSEYTSTYSTGKSKISRKRIYDLTGTLTETTTSFDNEGRQTSDQKIVESANGDTLTDIYRDWSYDEVGRQKEYLEMNYNKEKGGTGRLEITKYSNDRDKKGFTRTEVLHYNPITKEFENEFGVGEGELSLLRHPLFTPIEPAADSASSEVPKQEKKEDARPDPNDELERLKRELEANEKAAKENNTPTTPSATGGAKPRTTPTSTRVVPPIRPIRSAAGRQPLAGSTAAVVYREAAAMLNHLGTLLQISKQGHSWRLGAQYLEMQSVPDWDADAELRDFSQNDLDNLFRPYEDKIRQLEKSILDRRIALDQRKTSANEFFAGIYADVLDAVSWEWEAELTAALNGNYALVAYAYKLEKVLRKIYRDTDEALRKSVPYNVKTAKLAQLAAQQSEARRGLFNLLAKRYQIQKDALAMLRRHWSSELGRWQGFASGFSLEANDAHAEAARMFAARTIDLFSKDGRYQRAGSLGPGSVGSFAFVNSPKDYIAFPYGDYDWCKARAFPDIQFERCDRLDMYDIVNDRLAAANARAEQTSSPVDDDGLPPPELPDSIRRRCEPEYSQALDRAQLVLNDAADARRTAKAHSNDAERARNRARIERENAGRSRSIAAEARAKGRAEAKLYDAHADAYEKEAREADALAQTEARLAAQKEQEAARFDQQAEQIRRKAALDCLRKK